MDSAPDIQAFGKRCDTVLAAYIAGQTSFESCVEALVILLRGFFQLNERVPKPSSHLPATIIAEGLYRIGAGFSGSDLEKAHAAVRAALAMVVPPAEGAV